MPNAKMTFYTIAIYAAGVFVGLLLPLHFRGLVFVDVVAIAASYAIMFSPFFYLGGRRAVNFCLPLIFVAGLMNGLLQIVIGSWSLQTFPGERSNTIGLGHVISALMIFVIPYFSGKYFLIRSRRNKSESSDKPKTGKTATAYRK